MVRDEPGVFNFCRRCDVYDPRCIQGYDSEVGELGLRTVYLLSGENFAIVLHSISLN